MKRKLNVLNIIAILLSILVIVFFSSNKTVVKANPVELYRVYVKGDTIGYIENKEELEKYINDSQNDLKKKYNTEKVYLPHDLIISKEITYDKNPSSIKLIYDKIVEKTDFTIEGYTITIKALDDDENKNDRKIYVLDNKLFEESVNNIVKIFVKDELYKKFTKGEQKELKGAGSLIEDIYIKNKISIKKGTISSKNKIFTDLHELNRYLLYGDILEEKKYTVKRGEIISDIAFNNKLSVQEFLIANQNFTSENNLLSEGQVVNVSVPDPVIKVVEEDHVVEFQTISYDTKIVYDESLTLGFAKIQQEGKNGRVKLNVKVQRVNGALTSYIPSSREDIEEMIPKIIVRGGKKVLTIGELGIWKWPTAKPSSITSPFAYRKGKFHYGIDIAGPGCGSPIYATNNGVVDTVGIMENKDPFTSVNGNFIYIDHNNGYFSEYAHLQRIVVQKGQSIEMGQLIGYMGNTGYSFGCHLHFGISRGKPRGKGEQYINPLQLVVY